MEEQSVSGSKQNREAAGKLEAEMTEKRQR